MSLLLVVAAHNSDTCTGQLERQTGSKKSFGPGFWRKVVESSVKFSAESRDKAVTPAGPQ